MKNKHKFYFCAFLPCLLAGLFVFSKNIYAEKPKVIINELMWMGSSASTADEWIELKNLTSDSIDFNLTPWSLYKNDSLMIVIDKGILAKNGYFLISNNSKDHSFTGGKSILDTDPDIANTDISLSNSSARYKLYDMPLDTGGLIDVADDGTGTPLAGENGTTKKSMERNDAPGDGTAKENWHSCFSPMNLDADAPDCATPGAQNSKEPPPPPPTVYSNKIWISELLPKPDTENSEDKNEFVELYNPSDESEKLDKWFLQDRSGKVCDLSGKTIGPESFLVVKNNTAEKCTLALNDTQGELLSLYNPGNAEPISTAGYDGSAKKGLSYSFAGKNWRWSKFLTPGAENVFNNLPQVKNDVPEKIYVGTYADFSAKGSDKDKDKLKYTWDFGDGHKSYLQKTRHKYLKTGEYTVTLKVDDGSEDKLETFKIEVEKFPELSVKITGLSPNPAGADTGKEYLEIKNATKKKINLKNWSVGSGTKKLANHPITEDFFIKPGKTARITYAVSKFTLPNTKGKIELRYPNGKVASHVSYGNKKKSIAEGATYEKTKSGWKWNLPFVKTAATEKPADATEITAVILPQENTPAQPKPAPVLSEKDLGRSTPSPTWQSKKETRFSLLNFGLGIKTAQAFSEENHPSVKNYFSAQNFPAQKHWFLVLLENLNVKINYFLNKPF